MYKYNFYPEYDNEKFNDACSILEFKYPEVLRVGLLEDIDGTTVRLYKLKGREINVYNHFEVGAVYVLSEVDLGILF